MFDGGVLVNVIGRLQVIGFFLKLYTNLILSFLSRKQVDEDPPHAYSQVFVLKPMANSFFCQHDMFRLNIHDTA